MIFKQRVARSEGSRQVDSWIAGRRDSRPRVNNCWTELILCLRRAWYLLAITIFLNFPKQLTKKVEEQLCCSADKIVFSSKLEWNWHRIGYSWGQIWVSWSPKLKWFWRTYDVRVNVLFHKSYKTHDRVNIAGALESERSENFSFISFMAPLPLDMLCICKEKKSLLFLLSLLFMS